MKKLIVLMMVLSLTMVVGCKASFTPTAATAATVETVPVVVYNGTSENVQCTWDSGAYLLSPKEYILMDVAEWYMLNNKTIQKIDEQMFCHNKYHMTSSVKDADGFYINYGQSCPYTCGECWEATRGQTLEEMFGSERKGKVDW